MPPPQTPAPGILAVHGYINSRETQDGFAIEFARRGYVVLALDQTGHGYSDPPASPTASAAPMGWPICAASTSSTRTISASKATRWAAGPCSPPPPRCPMTTNRWCWRDRRPANRSPPTARPTWPRNVALVFAQYEEFSTLMWGVDHGPRRHPEPETLGPVRHARPGRAGQGLWRHRARHSAGALHPRHHPSGRAHLARGHRLQPRLVRQNPAGRHAPPGRRPDLVPQGDRHPDRAARFCRAFDRRVRWAAGSADVFPAAAARDGRRHHARAFRGRRPALDHGLHPVRLHPGADLLSGVRARRYLRNALRLPAPGHHQPDPGLGRHQRPDHARPDAVCAQTRQPLRHRRPSRS